MGYNQSTQINSAVRGFKSWQDEGMAESSELFNGLWIRLFCADRTVYTSFTQTSSNQDVKY